MSELSDLCYLRKSRMTRYQWTHNLIEINLHQRIEI